MRNSRTLVWTKLETTRRTATFGAYEAPWAQEKGLGRNAYRFSRKEALFYFKWSLKQNILKQLKLLQGRAAK